jgi:hypothetical protein
MLPNTPDRVPLHTSAAVNRRIQQNTAESVRWHARHPERLDQRLRELDAEWDIERTLKPTLLPSLSPAPCSASSWIGASLPCPWP